MARPLRIKLVTVGASWGGIEASSTLFSALPADFPVPIVFVQHQRMSSEDRLARLLARKTVLKVVSIEHGMTMQPGSLYIAPAGYHTLMESDGTLALSLHWPVHYSRPSIDELFITAGDVFGRSVAAVLLTGANEDGAVGMRHIAMRGGITVAQDPATAEAPVMPAAAIDAGGVGNILPLEDIADFLIENAFGLEG